VLPFAAVHRSARPNDSELVFSFLGFSRGDVSATCIDVSTRPCSLVVMFPRAVSCEVSCLRSAIMESDPNAFDAQTAYNSDTVRLSVQICYLCIC
jgi:hypothetical protein